MKILILSIVFLSINLMPLYSRGISEMKLVNEQVISLENINSITIRYTSAKITVFQNRSTDSFHLKEYMNEENSSLFAKITNSDGNIVIEEGRHFQVFRRLNRQIEVHIPVSNINFNIRTSSGQIEILDEIMASSVNIISSSGSISFAKNIKADRVNFGTSSGRINGGWVDGNTVVHTNSGGIDFGIINGDVSARSSSGRIEIGPVSGMVDINTSSGSIDCTITQNAGNISITSTSGRVTLNIPKNTRYNFSSRTSSGSLRTPFNDILFSPVSDRRSVQGIIEGNENQENRSIIINTTSGSININWAD